MQRRAYYHSSYIILFTITLSDCYHSLSRSVDALDGGIIQDIPEDKARINMAVLSHSRFGQHEIYITTSTYFQSCVF